MQNAIATAPAATGDSLIRSHEKLIRHLAGRFVGSGVSIDDLMQEGRIALWNASKRWRVDGGANLWTFAKRSVFAAMLRCASTHIANYEAHDALDDETTGEESSLEVALLVQECLEVLNAEEREILRLFLSGESLRSIGVLLGRSTSAVDRIFQAAVTTLRERAS